MHNKDEFGYDDIFDEGHDLFVTDDGDKDASSCCSQGEYLTEQAHHNDLEQKISITERSSKFLLKIYVQLLRVIRPIELAGSYKKAAKESPEIRMEGQLLSSSPRAQLSEDELDEDELLI